MSMRYQGGVISATPPTTSTTSATGVWTKEQQFKAQGAGTWPLAPWQVSRSLRFNSADSAYLNRTPGSAGNRTTWTWSGWVKRSKLGAAEFFFGAGTSNTDRLAILFDTTDCIIISGDNSSVQDLRLETTQLFRDPSAWYHIVFALDSTQATNTNRAKLYVNGSQVTAFSLSTYPSQNTTFQVNSTNAHVLGVRGTYSVTNLFDGYMTEVNFIDGQALTPSSFGWSDPATGVWVPIKYTGTYGTNGFYVNFSDNSGTTSTTLGKDYSGNGNNWTPNNFSVTAGAGNDSLVDTPTPYGTDTGAGGEVRGNYCTWNPLYASSPTLSNGNLDATTNVTTAYGSMSVKTGKWYWEITVGTATYIGIINSTYIKSDNGWTTEVFAYKSDGNKYNNTSSSYGASYTNGDIIGVALDMDAGTLVFYKNGSSQGTAFSSNIAGTEMRAMVYSSTSGTQTGNFGQRPFAYTAPSGYQALCTQNLSTPTIGATPTTQAGNYFNPVLYTGSGATKSITGVGFQPDLVWIKSRSNAEAHKLTDAVRGTTKSLDSASTAAEATDSTGLTAFGSDGFTLGSGANYNTSAYTYVAWNWRASGSTVSNTSGSITSTVSANTTAGFSIATYTGTGSNATVGHGLGVAPSMVIVKCRNTAGENWQVYHISLTSAAYRLRLNSDAAEDSQTTMWNSTAPTSTVFSVGTSSGVNANTQTYVAYCFAAIAGYSAFGSYTGNGSADGPFIYTGFRPAFIMVKNRSSIVSWLIIDSKRNTYNAVDAWLWPNLSDATYTYTTGDFLSNGIKLRNTGSGTNTNGDTYIYAAFAEMPFKYAVAR